jgi:molybdate transport repressor ModE-like protein
MTERKRTDVDWQDLRMFLALGRRGSLSAAARTLGVNHATIARRIQALEASLDQKLVERRPDGYVLTPAGQEAVAAASEMEAAAQRLGRAGTDDGAPRGLVRINAPPALAEGFLIARLAALAVLHPGLDIDLASDLRSVSLERRQADIAVRLSRPDDGDVVAKPLLSLGYGFYGIADLCERIEAGGEPVFIGFDEADAFVPEAAWLSRHFPRARVAFRAANQFSQALAARAGAGLALLPHYIGRADDNLRRWAFGPPPPSRDAFLITRRGDRNNRPVRIIAEHIVQLFHDERALFE